MAKVTSCICESNSFKFLDIGFFSEVVNVNFLQTLFICPFQVILNVNSFTRIPDLSLLTQMTHLRMKLNHVTHIMANQFLSFPELR